VILVCLNRGIFANTPLGKNMNTSKIQNWKNNYPIIFSFLATISALTLIFGISVGLILLLFRFTALKETSEENYHTQSLAKIYTEHTCEIREVHPVADGSGNTSVHECTNGDILYIQNIPKSIWFGTITYQDPKVIQWYDFQHKLTL
jgi:hypothetical protein